LNHLSLLATLVQRDALRYTPSGVPVLECVFKHQSTQIEAGQERMVEFEIQARALGTASDAVAQCEIGQIVKVIGFLNRQRKGSSKLTLHVNHIELI